MIICRRMPLVQERAVKYNCSHCERNACFFKVVSHISLLRDSCQQWVIKIRLRCPLLDPHSPNQNPSLLNPKVGARIMHRALDDSRIDEQTHEKTCQGFNDWLILRDLGDSHIIYGDEGFIYKDFCSKLCAPLSRASPNTDAQRLKPWHVIVKTEASR